MPDCVHDELGLIVDAQLLHEIALVYLDGLCAQAQKDGNLFDAVSFGEQLQDLVLSGR